MCGLEYVPLGKAMALPHTLEHCEFVHPHRKSLLAGLADDTDSAGI